MNKLDRKHGALAIAVLCLLVFYAAAVANLKRFPIGNDEYNSWNRILDSATGAPYSLAQTVRDVTIESPQHGPAYFILLNIWRTLVGAELFTLRLLSVFFGLLALAVTYRLAASVGDEALGLTAFFIAAFLAYLLYYSHLARMYTLLPLTSGWLLWAYARVMLRGRRPSRIAWLTLLSSAALMLYIHYFGIMLLAALGLYHLVFAKKDRRWLKVSLLMVTAGLLFMPWLPVAVFGFPGRPDVSNTRLPLQDSIFHILRLFSNGLVFFPVIALVAAVIRRRRLKQGEFLVSLVAVFTLLLILLSNEIAAIFSDWQMRYMSVLVVPFCCAIAIGLRQLPGWSRLRLPLAALWIAAFALFYRSDDLLVATGARIQNLDKMP
ncbi:MAG: glycosyltransferase family 39 protein, partial [Chloroflexota bacterium]|nr:glycosyltransferase family 39 protein [Chloroflexota bacterium]